MEAYECKKDYYGRSGELYFSKYSTYLVKEINYGVRKFRIFLYNRPNPNAFVAMNEAAFLIYFKTKFKFGR